MFAEILFSPIGWLYLWIRYRNRDKIKKELQDKYDNEYYIAGAHLSTRFFAVIFLGLLIIFFYSSNW